MSEILGAKHSGNVGDIIYSLPALLSLLQKKDLKSANYYLNINVKSSYSGWHPLGDLLLNEDFANKLIPLLQSQSYIDKVEIYKGQNFHIDFDVFRKLPIPSVFNPRTYCIPRWYFLFLEANWDLSQPWLHVNSSIDYENTILVARNPRLQSSFINYKFLNKYSKEIVFVGVKHEYDLFKQDCPDCNNFFEADNFLQLAEVIKGSRFLIANQGLIYTLAEAMKSKRILETNNIAANNIPTGPNGYEALFQSGMEYWFKQLYEGKE